MLFYNNNNFLLFTNIFLFVDNFLSALRRPGAPPS